MKERSHRVTISRWSAGLAISLAAVGMVALSLGYAGYIGNTGSFIDNPVERIAGLLKARSPGNRTDAKLTKSKARSGSTELPLVPESERMLGKIFPPDDLEHVLRRPEELLAGNPSIEQLIELSPELSTPDDFAETQLAGVMPSSGGIGGPGWFIGGGSGGGGSSGGGGGGAGGGGGDQPPALPPSAVPAIPEPSSWAMMILGVLLCAASMRRQNRWVRLARA